MTQDLRPAIPTPSRFSQLRQTAAPVLFSILLAACATSIEAPTDAAAPAAPDFAVSNTDSRTAEDYLALATYWGGLYDTSPGDRDAALNFGRALRHLGRHGQALDVMKDAAQRHSDDAEILAEYGKVLTSSGRSLEGSQFLAQANARRPGDWTSLSAEGVALDNLGDHQQARVRYEEALKSSPGNPTVLNNLALSRALDGDIKEAESYMREAVGRPQASPRMRQNLALILGLQGQYDEARRYASVDLPPAAVEENMDYIKSMVDKPSPWSELQSLDE